MEYNNKWIKDMLHAIHIQIVHVTVYLACFPSPSHLVFIEFGMTFMTLKTILSYTLISYYQLLQHGKYMNVSFELG